MTAIASWTRVAAGVAAVLAALAPAGAADASPSAVPAGPSVQLVPHPGILSLLDGLSCPSVRSCWAVGEYAQVQVIGLNQSLHWNGKRWSQRLTPNPGGIEIGDDNHLNGVSCTSASNCWAVGVYGQGKELNQALHWNGRKWSQVRTPNPGGTGTGAFNVLDGVRCNSPADCWTVGVFGHMITPTTEALLNQALHWNGTRWTLISTPSPGGTAAGDFSNLLSVGCAGARNCWAVGEFGVSTPPGFGLNQVLHWNGKRWSRIRTPNPAGTLTDDFNVMSAVSCSSSTNCWAAGRYGSEAGGVSTNLNQMLHWNGVRWSRTVTPDPDGTGAGASNMLNDIFCSTAANCWSVGTFGSVTSSGGMALNQALHWNGKKWSQVSAPNPGGTANDDTNILISVRCPAAANCWAVGGVTSGGNPMNEALHWNGRRWSAG